MTELVAPMATCDNPTKELVLKWFDEAGRNTRHGPAKRKRQDYPPPDLQACELVAHRLAALEMWGQPRPTKWPPPRARDWWTAARLAWVHSAFAWKDGGKQPARINSESAVVHFVHLALSHFGMSRSKHAIARALRYWKKQADIHCGGDLARRNGVFTIITTNSARFDEWGVFDPLPTRTGVKQGRAKKYPT